MFNESFSRGKKFTFNSNGLPFIKLADLPVEKVFVVREVFINPKSRYGKTASVVTDDAKINVPSHLIKDIEVILSRPDMITAINNGECGFKRTADYTTNTGYVGVTGTFVDII